MAVLLPNTWLGVRRRGAATPDAHGDIFAAATWADPAGPWPGALRTLGGEEMTGGEQPYSISLDPAADPVNPHDLIVEYAQVSRRFTPTGREWLVETADTLHHTGDPSVDYIRCRGHLRVGASTQPG